jgi:hypothetical protein
MTPQEMLDAGFVIREDGFWRAEAMINYKERDHD